MSGDTRSRAAEALGVGVDVTSVVATRALLAGLEKSDFVPSGDTVAALNTLAGLAIPVEADTSPTLREEVEEFAQRYWSLAPADRLASWLALSTRFPDDTTAERLLKLQGGLEVPGTPLTDPAWEHVASIARLLYVLPPRERAIRRNEWLLANAVRHKELLAAGAAIQTNHPQVAALDPDLFARLTPKFNAWLFAEAAHASPGPTDTDGAIEYPLPERRKPVPASSDKTSVRAAVILAILMIVGGLRGIGSLGGNHSAPPSPSISIPRGLPNHQWAPVDEPESLQWFTQAQVDSCQDYEKGKTTKAPPYYVDWVEAGKPAPYVAIARPKAKSTGRKHGSDPPPRYDWEK